MLALSCQRQTRDQHGSALPEADRIGAKLGGLRRLGADRELVFEFALPLSHKSGGSQNERSLDLTSYEVLAKHEAGFDRLAQADLVGQ